MKEYWVNVYDQDIKPLYEYSGKHPTKDSAIRIAEINATYCQHPIIYRIRVKLKNPKLIGRQISVKLMYGTKYYDWWNN